MPEHLRVGWNLLPLRRDHEGGWRYVRALLSAASRHLRDSTFVALVTPESLPLVEDLPAVRPVLMHFTSKIRSLRVLVEHVALPAVVRRQRLDCLHCFLGTAPRGIDTALALTVFDLIAFHRPQTFSLVKRWYLHRALPESIRRADVVLPMSETTARDLSDRFGIDRAGIATLPPVMDDDWVPSQTLEVEALRERLSLPAKFWLYVAAGYPHKNHERLLQALVELRRQGLAPWPLVLRGSRLRDFEGRAAELGVHDLVRFTPRLGQADLRALYCAASGCVFPSLFEGAGLPVLEAMACGVPLIASDIPTNREFTDGYAQRFDPESVRAIANAMASMQREPPDRSALRRVATARLEPLRPGRIAVSLQTAYETAVARASHKNAASSIVQES